MTQVNCFQLCQYEMIIFLWEIRHYDSFERFIHLFYTKNLLLTYKRLTFMLFTDSSTLFGKQNFRFSPEQKAA